MPVDSPSLLPGAARSAGAAAHRAGARHRAVLAAGIAVLASACSDAAGPGGGPPANTCLADRVAYSDEPEQVGSVEHVHDPAIIRHGDMYYVFSTNDGIPIRRSRDLVRWEWVGRVFPDQVPGWAPSAVPGVQAPWAPDVAFFNGKYHLYYSLSTFGSQRSVIGLVTNPTLDPADPSYRWDDQGPVLESHPGVDDHNAIDPNVVFDEAGNPWMSWGSWWGGIKMRRLDAVTGKLATDDTTEHSLAARPAGSEGIEAPFIIRRGEFYYLFVSFDLCCRGAESTYNVRVGRSREVTGPYVDRRGTPLMQGGGTPLLQGYGRIRGPGHNAVLEDGGRHYLVHHFYDARANGVPKLQVRPLLWDTDGWPLAAAPYDGTDPAPATQASQVVGSWGYWVGLGAPTRQSLHADGTLQRCDGTGTWRLDSPWLTLSWSPSSSPQHGVTQSSWISADGRFLVGRTQEDQVVRGYRLGP